ncbi:MAG TPA: hypothetical protein VLL75_22180, partial [Vicinamibacteria bacterium]|nr:hypothetical protein [Vicinamibacteria bacterium]
MTCPTCGGELVPGADRCPVCDAGAAPRVEGALAADPRLVTPPARPKPRVEPLRDIPGLRKRERSWRDEVQERVRSRRQKRAAAGLPLFDQPDTLPPSAKPEAPLAAGPVQPLTPPAPAAPPVEERIGETAREPGLVSTRLSEAELTDLPLRAPGPDVPEIPTGRAAPSLDDDDALVAEPDLEPEMELAPPAAEPSPVERPARAIERLRAAAVDGLLFGAL